MNSIIACLYPDPMDIPFFIEILWARTDRSLAEFVSRSHDETIKPPAPASRNPDVRPLYLDAPLNSPLEVLQADSTMVGLSMRFSFEISPLVRIPSSKLFLSFEAQI